MAAEFRNQHETRDEDPTEHRRRHVGRARTRDPRAGRAGPRHPGRHRVGAVRRPGAWFSGRAGPARRDGGSAYPGGPCGQWKVASRTAAQSSRFRGPLARAAGGWQGDEATVARVSARKYAEVMARRRIIMQRALGLDYEQFEREGGVAFDYEGLVGSPAYDLDAVRRIQADFKVGNTPLWELPRLSQLVRQTAPRGHGARILIKDEAGNAAGSFKARRASLAVAAPADLGYDGVVAATSGNYGAAVASQAAMRGIKAIILQEVFDSKWRGQPEILEKTRVCEAYGAEVWQVTVGPELFYWHLITLEETGFFNASLYTPSGILGIETLGYEIAEQCRHQFGKDPAAILITHSGGGNVTGTARGLRRAGADPEIIGVSVDLAGLHMASDHDFNRKSFTTGHTGFGFPFTVNPDRVDVPRNAARGLRYLDRYVTITQGEGC